jgi:flagellar biosynthesis chaperone FliJ
MNELTKKLEESRTNLKKRRSYALEKNITEGLAEFEEYAKDIASANKEFFEYMENLKSKFKATKKQIRDYEKRIEFLDLKIESKRKNYQKFQQDFTKTQEQYDDLIVALSRALTQKRKEIS